MTGLNRQAANPPFWIILFLIALVAIVLSTGCGSQPTRKAVRIEWGAAPVQKGDGPIYYRRLTDAELRALRGDLKTRGPREF